jgi:tetratricopeptide (TPR) repeat protein
MNTNRLCFQFRFTCRVLVLPIGHALIAVCLFAAFTTRLEAQTPPPTDASPGGGQLAQELLQSLQDFRKQQNQMPELKLPSATAIPGESPEQQRLRSIQQRMELIRSLVQQKQEAEAAKQRSAAAADAGTQPAADVTSASGTGAEQSADGKQVTPAPPEFPLPDLQAGPETVNPKEQASTPPKYLGQTVVPSAVDPLELANSLFQTGNYELALKTYLAVADKLDKPQDALWTEYFIASCRRILGDLPNAEKGYRGLVESRRPTRPVEAARWWLENVERRKNIESTINQIDSYLQGVTQELSPNAK